MIRYDDRNIVSWRTVRRRIIRSWLVIIIWSDWADDRDRLIMSRPPCRQFRFRLFFFTWDDAGWVAPAPVATFRSRIDSDACRGFLYFFDFIINREFIFFRYLFRIRKTGIFVLFQ